jgi:hypothetical protein
LQGPKQNSEVACLDFWQLTHVADRGAGFGVDNDYVAARSLYGKQAPVVAEGSRQLRRLSAGNRIAMA